MGSILNEADRAAIGSRLRSLSVSSTGRWGSMDVAAMLQHLRLSAQWLLASCRCLPRTSARSRCFPSST